MKKMELVELDSTHLEMILGWRNSPEVRKNMYTNHVISVEEHFRWFESLRNNETKLYFVFFLNGEACGVIGFTDLNVVKKISSWAFYANPNAVRGTGSLMEFNALDYAFNTLNLYKLRCEVLSFNNAVVKLHLKFGFKLEGQHRGAYYDGLDYHDVAHLGIFAHEWSEGRETIMNKLGI